MSTELDTIRNDSAIMVLPPAQHPAQAAIEMLRGHADMMSMAYDLATKMCRTQLVPTRFHGKPEDATAAILYGAELGLNPIQALQRVIPIHGMPTIEARTMVALLKARGYKIKVTAQSDESVTVWGQDLDGQEYESTWTIQRAEKAGYTRNAKYETDPQAMLKAKAQAEVCRDMAPDVLLGISYSTEDMAGEQRGDRPDSGGWSDGAITVDEIVGEPAAARQPGFKDKVKSASAEPVDESDAAASENCPEPETGQVSDTDQAVDEPPPVDAPGAPTESTPGQTGRVEAALGNARIKTTSSARDALTGLIEAVLKEAGYRLADLPAIAGSVLKMRVKDAGRMTDSQLKTVYTSLKAWQQVGTLADMVTQILDTADMQAEDGAQQATDGTEAGDK